MYPLHSLETRYGHPRQKLQTKHFVGVSLVHFVEFREKAAYKVLLESKSAKNVFACLVLVVLVVQHSHFTKVYGISKNSYFGKLHCSILDTRFKTCTLKMCRCKALNHHILDDGNLHIFDHDVFHIFQKLPKSVFDR